MKKDLFELIIDSIYDLTDEEVLEEAKEMFGDDLDDRLEKLRQAGLKAIQKAIQLYPQKHTKTLQPHV